MPLFQCIFAKHKSELAVLEEPNAIPGSSSLCVLIFLSSDAAQRWSFQN